MPVPLTVIVRGASAPLAPAADANGATTATTREERNDAKRLIRLLSSSDATTPLSGRVSLT